MIFEILLIIAVRIFGFLLSLFGWVIPSSWIQVAQARALDFYESFVIATAFFLDDVALIAVVAWINFAIGIAFMVLLLKGVRKIVSLLPT